MISGLIVGVSSRAKRGQTRGKFLSKTLTILSVNGRFFITILGANVDLLHSVLSDGNVTLYRGFCNTI